MNQSERNEYHKTTYGDYRTIERDDGLPMDQATGARVFVNRVYNWMFCGLMVTTILAWGVDRYAATGEAALRTVAGLFIPCAIVELILVIVLSAAIRKISVAAAGVMFIVYSALNGITFSAILLQYTQTSMPSISSSPWDQWVTPGDCSRSGLTRSWTCWRHVEGNNLLNKPPHWPHLSSSLSLSSSVSPSLQLPQEKERRNVF